MWRESGETLMPLWNGRFATAIGLFCPVEKLKTRHVASHHHGPVCARTDFPA